MVVRFDTLDRLEKPVMTLCNPGAAYNNGVLSNAIGCLSGTEAEEFVFNFNSISELNFCINKVDYDDTAKTAAANQIYSAVKNRRMIFINEIGFFVIKNVEEKIEGEKKYKYVQAESVDTELQQRMIPYIEDGTYRFSTDGTDIGILDKIVGTLALWSIGHVDSTIASKHRTFEDVDTNQNCLAFMIDQMQEAYECIILFDPIYRRINVYDQDTYTSNDGIQTDIHLSTDDILNSITITEGSEDLYTAMRVYGGDGDDVYISCVNPTGQNVIYDFTYYYDWMSQGLSSKLRTWTSDIAAAESTYKDLNIELSGYVDNLAELNEDKAVIELNLSICERTLGNVQASASTESLKISEEDLREVVYNGTTLYETSIDVDNQDKDELIAAINADITSLNNALSTVNAAITSEQARVDNKSAQVQAIVAALDLSSRLSDEEEAELQNYIFEGEYKDEYALITEKMTDSEKFDQREQMYDRAKKQLAKVSHPTQEFDVDTQGFIFSKKFIHFASELKTGCIITLDIEGETDPFLMFLSSITVNYDDKNMSMTFSNSYNKFDPRSLFDDVLGSVSRSANTISYIKDVIYPLKSGDIDTIKDALQNARNMTMANAVSATDQSVIIDSTGYTGRRSDGDGGFEPEQVKIVNNSIVFTDNDWETCRAALGKMTIPDPEHPGQSLTVYGLCADALIGNLVLTQNLRVENEDSTIVLDESGMTFDGLEFKKVKNTEITMDSWTSRLIIDDCTSYYQRISIGSIQSSASSAFLEWFYSGYEGTSSAYVKVSGDDNYYKMSPAIISGTAFLVFNYDMTRPDGDFYFIDSTKPAIAISAPQLSGSIYKSEVWSTEEPTRVYELYHDVPTGAIVELDNDGITITEKDNMSTETSASGIVAFFTALFAKIKNMFSTSTSGLFEKVGFRVINRVRNDKSLLSADTLAFQDGTNSDNVSYYGLYGAQTNRLYVKNGAIIEAGITSGDILATSITSQTTHFYPNDTMTIQNLPLCGDVTSSGSLLRFAVPLDRLMDSTLVDTATINSMSFSIRGINGYIGFLDSNNVEHKPDSSNSHTLQYNSSTTYMSLTVAKSTNNMLRINLTGQNGLTHVTNNTPVTLFCNSMQITFTKSQS